jgi:YD repeat-containing protein
MSPSQAKRPADQAGEHEGHWYRDKRDQEELGQCRRSQSESQGLEENGDKDVEHVGRVRALRHLPGERSLAVHPVPKHDRHGSILKQQDAFGNTSRITYDDHGILPVGATTPLGHRFKAEIDYRAGAIKSIEDPNQCVTTFRFDPLGRLSAIIKPGDTDVFPTQEFDYLDDTIPMGVLSRCRTHAGQPDTYDTIEYNSGYGRSFQIRSSAEDGKVMVDAWRRHNRRGWLAVSSTPFRADSFEFQCQRGRQPAASL